MIPPFVGRPLLFSSFVRPLGQDVQKCTDQCVFSLTGLVAPVDSPCGTVPRGILLARKARRRWRRSWQRPRIVQAAAKNKLGNGVACLSHRRLGTVLSAEHANLILTLPGVRASARPRVDMGDEGGIQEVLGPPRPTGGQHRHTTGHNLRHFAFDFCPPSPRRCSSPQHGIVWPPGRALEAPRDRGEAGVGEERGVGDGPTISESASVRACASALPCWRGRRSVYAMLS